LLRPETRTCYIGDTLAVVGVVFVTVDATCCVDFGLRKSCSDSVPSQDSHVSSRWIYGSPDCIMSVEPASNVRLVVGWSRLSPGELQLRDEHHEDRNARKNHE